MSVPGEQPDRMQWTVHPVRRSPWTAAAVSAAILAIALMVHRSYGDVWLTALSLLVLLGSLRTFYLPSRYVLDREGITYACFPLRLRRPWTAFKGVQVMDGAVRLSPFREPSRLDPHRGLLLRFENDGDRIAAYLERRLKEQAG